MNAKKPQQKSSVRIIAGRWRNSRIHFLPGDGLRPTGDRVRETLFNWLSPIIMQSRCLDLFAGSGILGMEALSRGASQIVFVEKSNQAANTLRSNLERIGAESYQLFNTDAESWLQRQHNGEQFDIVFLDPPFALDGLQHFCNRLEEKALLSEGAFVYAESPSHSRETVTPQNWRIFRQKTAGDVRFCLYQRDAVRK
ncbi:MAG: 16S rRNA (guanine(966)-N(2))-methyltransferase RsmD [Pseudomonadales bacterium]|nr:16S rRNA (guanine(966)-N(2))-methyltransferase RsmD [Pseudomonadales bacterium]